MKRKVSSVVLAMAVAVGFAVSPGPAHAQSAGLSGAVQEVADWGKIPDGYADLRITASLKTHTPGVHSTPDVHGTADYKLLLKIDGQQVPLPATLRNEETEMRSLPDSEAGQGVQYRFYTRVRLPAGKHTVTVAVPGEEIVVEREITLAAESSNTLSLKPLYRWTPGERLRFYGTSNFRDGLKGFTAVLNEQPL